MALFILGSTLFAEVVMLGPNPWWAGQQNRKTHPIANVRHPLTVIRRRKSIAQLAAAMRIRDRLRVYYCFYHLIVARRQMEMP
ncbi:MAG: hypothetical protein IV097_02840 [Burkholderiaceae bacterium]|nr:hypothetical protein [Burkholderiaceae bacterium]